jgi:hypothetical protein
MSLHGSRSRFSSNHAVKQLINQMQTALPVPTRTSASSGKVAFVRLIRSAQPTRPTPHPLLRSILAWHIYLTSVSRILPLRCRSEVGYGPPPRPSGNRAPPSGGPVIPNGRGTRSPGALNRVSGAEGVCGLLAVGYHYLRRNRGHARVPRPVFGRERGRVTSSRDRYALVGRLLN